VVELLPDQPKDFIPAQTQVRTPGAEEKLGDILYFYSFMVSRNLQPLAFANSSPRFTD